MDTPNTNNGRVLERIMQAFWHGNIAPLTTEQYNKVWSRTLQILDEEYEEPSE